MKLIFFRHKLSSSLHPQSARFFLTLRPPWPPFIPFFLSPLLGMICLGLSIGVDLKEGLLPPVSIWVFPKIGVFTTQIIHFNRGFPYKSSILGYHYSRRSAAGSARTKVTRCHKRKCRCRSRSNILRQIEEKMQVFTMFLQHQGQN